MIDTKNDYILEINNLCKCYGDNSILNNINLKIKKGEIYGILGFSGAGKSTLVRCINGLEKYDSGEIIFNGKKALFDCNYRRDISMIFQSFNLLDQRTVIKNVMLPGELVKDSKRYEKALEMLKLVGLANKINSYPSQLSGGEKQRVAIARSLMTNPKILLCDEATSALDPETTNQILDLLLKLNQELKLTIIMISHQMNVIERICHKVAILDKSQIIENGSAQDIFLSPKTDVGKKMVYAGHLNTELNDEKLIKIKFNGEIDTPIVANIICDCNVIVSIIYADSKVVEGRVYGQIIFKMPKDEREVKKVERYLQLKNVSFEEVYIDEYQQHFSNDI